MITEQMQTEFSVMNRIKESALRVVNFLLEEGPLSRPEIMKKTGLSQTAVHEAVKELLRLGLVSEQGIGASSGGRKPLLLEVNRRQGSAVGVKIDSRGISAALVDLAGGIMDRSSTGLPLQRTEDSIIEAIGATVESVIDGGTGGVFGVLGIGIGVSGIVDTEEGRLLESPILQLKDISIGSRIRKRFKLPVIVDHDVNVLLTAENRYGRFCDAQNIICVMVGRGIGGGIITDSRLYRGSKGASAEFGHMVIDSDGPRCRCGKNGCLTTLASDEFILSEIKRLPAAGRASLKTYAKNAAAGNGQGEAQVAALIAGARAGEPDLQGLYHRWVYHLAVGIDNLIRIFDPGIILVGRETLETENELIGTLRDFLGSLNTLSLYSDVELLPFSLRQDGWNLGAADLVFQNTLRGTVLQ
jgi:predicted NBD/HSP70 family sugar kinase